MGELLSVEAIEELEWTAETAKFRPVNPRWWKAQTKLKIDRERRENRGEVLGMPSERDEPWRQALKLSEKGYTGPAGGRQSSAGLFPEARGTTAQVPGLYPWSVGAGAPIVGTPLGMHLETGSPVCYDATNWMTRGGFITAPVTMVLALNGYGKSTLVRKMVLGSIAQKRTTLMLGDAKPDYRVLTEEVGGQVVELGFGHGRLNVLDPGAMGQVLTRLSGDPDYQRAIASDVRGRQVTTVAGLIELLRGRAIDDFEVTLLATGIELLYSDYGFTYDNPPILEDLHALIIAGHPDLYADAGLDAPEGLTPSLSLTDRDREAERAQGEDRRLYEEAIRPLRRSLNSLIRGELGAVFNGQSSVRLDLDAPAICVDVSLIPQSEQKLRAAVLMACWADGMAAVEGAHILADAGLAPKRTFHVVLDELWQVLGAGEALVDRVNSLTRLNRGIGTELTLCTHSYKDALSLSSSSAREKARGFFERARVKIIGPIPSGEVALLRDVVELSEREIAMVTGWATPEALTGEAARPGEKPPAPPGMGKFLLKVGEGSGPGIPLQTVLTDAEVRSQIHETNARYSHVNLAGANS